MAIKTEVFTEFAKYWTEQEHALFSTLNSPGAIQAFLDRISYSADPIYRCPKSVLRDQKAHCYDGALFAAAALWRLGFPPRIVDLIAERDDDHILALYRIDDHYGAVAKSNFVGLRFREPVYRSVRELAMSYFDSYYNLDREKSLRAYTAPLNLLHYLHLNWLSDDGAMDVIAERLDQIRRYSLVTPQMVQGFLPVDERTFQAGMTGAVLEGIYKP